jgi:hypothetical protein
MAKGYERLISQLNKMIINDRAGIAAVNSVLAQQKKRIFQHGKSSSGAKIGSYSTTPISISKKNQSRNTGKTYFPGGYRQYKSLTGKGSNTVNLRNTDQMMMDLGTTVVKKGQYGIGFNNQFNADKAEWNEERFDKEIFATTTQEDNTFMRVYEFEIGKIQ